MKFVVAFSSPKRSEKTVRLAAAKAKALDAELVLLRILPDPGKVGVVAQLISTDRPMNKVTAQINSMVEKLKAEGIKASGVIKVGEVAKGIITAVKEEKADILFVGTSPIGGRHFFALGTDPIARYLFNHCPTSICFVRGDIDIGATGTELVGDTTNVPENQSESDSDDA
ncbi:MAG TPA: universal stress protein [Oculatellaceae cyanobacterium]